MSEVQISFLKVLLICPERKRQMKTQHFHPLQVVYNITFEGKWGSSEKQCLILLYEIPLAVTAKQRQCPFFFMKQDI